MPENEGSVDFLSGFLRMSTWKIFLVVCVGFFVFSAIGTCMVISCSLLFVWYFSMLFGVANKEGVPRYFIVLFVLSMVYPLFLDINMYLGFYDEMVFNSAHSLSSLAFFIFLLMATSTLSRRSLFGDNRIGRSVFIFMSMFVFPVGIWLLTPEIRKASS